MDRWACVDVPQFLLQTLFDTHPSWASSPVAVVDRDTPQGVVVQCNRIARNAMITPGLRYGAALSLHPELRAAVVDAAQLAAMQQRIFAQLHDFSPHVEPGPKTTTSLFWLTITGLDKLFGGFDQWAQRAYDALRAHQIYASITVGWSRFGTFALTRDAVESGGGTGWRIIGSVEDEQRAVGKVRLDALNLPVKVREQLAKFAIERVNDLLALPESAVRKRFGAQAHELWRLASGAAETLPLQPVALDQPIQTQLELDDEVWNTTQLTFLIKRELHPLLLQLAARHHDLQRLEIALHARSQAQQLVIRPATPTLAEVRLLELCRLQLERLTLTAPIVRVDLNVHGVPMHREQTHIFQDTPALGRPRRDLHAANHALARLEAEFPGTVFQIERHDRHLPESKFSLKPFVALPPPQEPRSTSPPQKTLVRRIFRHPIPLPWARDPNKIGLEAQVVRTDGPYEISGGWWHDASDTAVREDAGVHRTYWFVETHTDILWVYWDQHRQQWFQHGVVQ